MFKPLSTLAGLTLLVGCAGTATLDPVSSSETSRFEFHTPALDAAQFPVSLPAVKPVGVAPEGSWTLASLAAAAPDEGVGDTSALGLATLFPADMRAPESLAPFDDRRGDDGRDNYLNARAGEVFPTDSNLSAGWFVGAAYGRYFTRLFSIEVAGSYFKPDVDGSPAADMYAVPLMANARVNLPIWLLQAYGGAGVGAFYYNIDGGALDGDGWLGAASVFVGADVTLFDRVSAGLELKYFVTDQIRNSNINLDAFTLAVTLGFRF